MLNEENRWHIDYAALQVPSSEHGTTHSCHIS